MPKDTFHNLSEDKQRKIFNAAVQEFSNHRFSEASINQIIKTAGIPRGSFYQYFNGKEDLYLYMFSEIGKEKQAVLHKAGELNLNASFFEVYLHNLRALLEWSKEKPKYNEIGMLMELDNNEFIVKLRTVATGVFARLRGLIEEDKKRGIIKEDVDAELVIDMIYTMNINLVKEYYRTGSVEDMLKRANNIINIIKEGIENPKKG